MVKVECLKIDDVHIYYECPFCWVTSAGVKGTNKKKNGNPYANSKSNIHRHGSIGGKIQQGIASRTSHCYFNREPVEIVIRYNTPRQTPIPITLHFD